MCVCVSVRARVCVCVRARARVCVYVYTFTANVVCVYYSKWGVSGSNNNIARPASTMRALPTRHRSPDSTSQSPAISESFLPKTRPLPFSPLFGRLKGIEKERAEETAQASHAEASTITPQSE